ncbi:MAG TPA: hypothetical protein VFO41_03295 [Alphaproteobacteria bacterium]|nr:hypothetical protein [Alphaproteobacteria bacterium]
MADEYAINFKCPVCGGTRLMLSEPGDDNSIASCGSCGSEFGRWGDIKANLMISDRPKSQSESTPKFKGLKGTFNY